MIPGYATSCDTQQNEHRSHLSFQSVALNFAKWASKHCENESHIAFHNVSPNPVLLHRMQENQFEACSNRVSAMRGNMKYVTPSHYGNPSHPNRHEGSSIPARHTLRDGRHVSYSAATVQVVGELYSFA